MKYLLMATIAVSMLAAACQPVQEPWIRSEDQLEQERARSREVQTVLRHRLRNVQIDRAFGNGGLG